MKPRKPKPKEEIKSMSDDFGNLIQTSDNGTRINVKLRLVSEKPKARLLGSINVKRKVMQIRRKRGLHLFRKTDSYGFNHYLLENAKKFDKIRLIDEYCEWLIPVRFILDNGSFMNFKQQGFELQIFLPLSKMVDYKRKPKF